MEAFLQGLPPGLSDRALRGHLQPLMEELSISDYNCSVHKKKVTATITFLHDRDGDKFLKRYGDSFQSTRKLQRLGVLPLPKLCLLSTPVNCNRSKRTPTKFALLNIHYEAEKRQSQAPRPDHKSVALAPHELSCGHAVLDERGFTVVAEWCLRAQYNAKFTKRNLILTIKSESGNNMHTEVRIPLQSINELVWDERGRVALVLTTPPMFLTLPAEDPFNPALIYGSKPSDPAIRMTSIDAEHAKVSGFCLVYHLSVPELTVGRVGKSDFHKEIQRLKTDGIVHVTRSTIHQEDSGAWSKYQPYSDCLKLLLTELSTLNQHASLPFPLLFLLQALVHNHYLHPNVVRELARHLAREFREAKESGKRQPISIEAFKRLFISIDYPSPDVDPAQFTAPKIMERLHETQASMILSKARGFDLSATENLVPILRATVTPTRVTLHGPELEPRNRVLRKFPSHTDYFLRVQFCDESGSDLFYNAKISFDKVYERFMSVLTGGIQIAGRLYKFLGFSHSSLRSHTVWMSAPFVYESMPIVAEKVIRGLGEFDVIRSPARRAARIGQAFSETPFSVPLDGLGIKVAHISDVKRHNRCFSDGVGTISRAALEDIWATMPETKRDFTALQVRWAGAKGMLCLDTELEGKIVCIRKSMVKFKSQDVEVLEICDVASRPLRFVLNRSVVKILEDMGAPKSWFFGLLEQELDRLKLVTSAVDHTAAFLEHQGVGDSIKLGDFLRRLERLGLDYKEDPFLRSTVEAVVLQELRLLKYKARLPVPKGITLFGAMDPTGFLEEGQVYVTYTPLRRRPAEPPGPQRVLVTRSPALHPGDIQPAWNVIPPYGHPLREQRNCIFFSQWGNRDLPSQLSGGDLDGDLFNIIWDPEVVDTVSSFRPAEYPDNKPLTVKEEITSTHIARFFVDFMKNDRLGPIANRHVMIADQEEKGTLHEDCLTLAELHSNAVDFSKTGRPVDIKDLPMGDKMRPDFMAPGPWVRIRDRSDIEMDEYVVEGEDDGEDDIEGPQHAYYKSPKILGQLHRAVNERQIWDESIRWNKSNGRHDDFWGILTSSMAQEAIDAGFGFPEWRPRVAEAEQLCMTYEDAVSEAMCRWSDHPSRPLTELEVVLGFILNKSGAPTHRQRDYSIKLKEDYDRVAASITKHLRRKSRDDSYTGTSSTQETLALCLAAVHVGSYDHKTRRGRGEGANGYSYRWRYKGTMGMQSFRILAASAFLREVADGQCPSKANGGGFVGMRGDASREQERGVLVGGPAGKVEEKAALQNGLSQPQLVDPCANGQGSCSPTPSVQRGENFKSEGGAWDGGRGGIADRSMPKRLQMVMGTILSQPEDLSVTDPLRMSQSSSASMEALPSPTTLDMEELREMLDNMTVDKDAVDEVVRLFS